MLWKVLFSEIWFHETLLLDDIDHQFQFSDWSVSCDFSDDTWTPQLSSRTRLCEKSDMIYFVAINKKAAFIGRCHFRSFSFSS